MISQVKLDKAFSFINKYARPLELELTKFEFSNKSNKDVLHMLRGYQNADGGFGNGLNPDIFYKGSSVYVTCVGLQYLDLIDVSYTNSMVSQSIQYLLDNIQFRNSMPWWVPNPIEINDSPHAPWWNVKSISPPDLNSWEFMNVEVIGYLNKYKKLVDDNILEKCNRFVNKFLENKKKIDSFIFCKYLSWKRSITNFSELLMGKIFRYFDNTFHSSNLLDNLGHVRVQWIVTERTSYLFEKFSQKINYLVSREIENQHTDGGWYPTWEWNNKQIDREFIRRSLAGKLTFDILSLLKYGQFVEFR